jgi:hypothetical protein
MNKFCVLETRLYAYGDNANGNASVVCAWYGTSVFLLGAFRIQNLQRTRVYSGTDYTSTVLVQMWIGFKELSGSTN